MTSGTLTILEGSTFCICDEIGDVTGETGGLFADDTRFLSRLRLTVNGKRPLLLSSGKVEYFSAAFFLRNPLAGGLGIDELSIERNRFVGQAMEDKLVFENQSMRRIEFDVDLEIGTDFADIMSVKAHDFALGDPLNAPPLPQLIAGDWDAEHDELLLEDSDPGGARTRIDGHRRRTGLDGEGRLAASGVQLNVHHGLRALVSELDALEEPAGAV